MAKRNQASRYRRLQGRADHRNPYRARTERPQGSDDPDARKRQGDARRARARGWRDRRNQGQGRRQGQPGRAACDLRRGRAGDGGGRRPVLRRRRDPGADAQAPRPRPPRSPPPIPAARRISRPTSSSSAPVPAAIPPPSAPPISGRMSCWSTPRQTLGGVCLNVGCIPSKALLHVAKIIDEAAAMARAWRRLRRAGVRSRRPFAAGRTGSSSA